jgi:phosphatidylglycerol---prolipoprotein diacylglyceryl transferase
MTSSRPLYWLAPILILFGLTAAFVYGRHLATGYTPPAVLAGAGWWPIYSSAVLGVVALLLGYAIVADLLGEVRHLLGMGPWLVLGGLVGARLYHVLAPAPSHLLTTADYLANPWLIIQIWSGGLGFYGALFGGGLALAIYAWWHKLPLRAWGDAAVVGLALGQAIGRWGHFFNQELYGQPSRLPWAVHISPPHRMAGLEEVATYHPTFLYESLWCLGLFALLYVGYQQGYARPGEGVVRYVAGYALGRLLIEAVRLDVATAVVAGISLPIASWLSLALLALASGWWLGGKRGVESRE